MDIGTAKPTREELASVPHHLIDICDPKDSYSAASFREDCIRLVDEITNTRCYSSNLRWHHDVLQSSSRWLVSTSSNRA